MFNSEMMPKEMRGKVGSFFEWIFWDFCVVLACAGVLLGIRMLVRRGRHDEAWVSLQWICADRSEATQKEMENIRLGVEMEARETEGFQFKELLQADNFKRVFAAFAIFTAHGDRNLLLIAIFGAVKVLACGSFVLFFSERLSRRQVLITTAAVVKVKTPLSTGEPALIYLFVDFYNFSWGPMPWPYVSEIFPIRIFDALIAICIFFFLKGTRGLSLEIIVHQRFKKSASAKDVEHARTINE
ncbi:uncharacterized protein BCR38DRAFT_461284 [Pseudomassariella vexata]|uniref:Uncharacterized protein n=1 Tax=Pseudomassariella vexata TaxID=1141098 RepID=A0A1Y2DE55_9PEZI|nr:uncharacterized protein BCR38DRAFT_461284 [Pseudomassariella vexata]ORY57573.1 hypothetical protein BCR38DRAFT_461284 [Pseudomassariella vexata]